MTKITNQNATTSSHASMQGKNRAIAILGKVGKMLQDMTLIIPLAQLIPKISHWKNMMIKILPVS
ncbi:MAG: hypothetical protein LLG04_01585 [Parachlamydia sp.]|nr:hypothetical protein [Parachlamydia sp.]